MNKYTTNMLVTLGLLTTNPVMSGPLYTLEIIVEQGDIIDGGLVGAISGVSLNNTGGAAFVSSTTAPTQVFTRTTRVAKLGDALDGSTLSQLVGSTDINRVGTVAFAARTAATGTDSYLLRYDTGSGTSVIAKPGAIVDGRTLTGVRSSASINDLGDSAFLSAFSRTANPDGTGAFTAGALSISSALPGVQTNPLSIIGRNDPIGFNNDGVAVFESRLTPTGSITAIMSSNGGVIAQLGNTIGGAAWTGVQVGGTTPVINDSGLVAFRGKTPKPGSGGNVNALWASDDRLVARTGDIIDGQTIGDLGAGGGATGFAINNRGEVAFRTRLDTSTNHGVFVDNHNLANTKTYIQGLDLGTVGTAIDINDSGQVLFSAQLGNGFSKHSALVLATPVVDDFAALFTAGSPAELVQTFSGAIPAGNAEVRFDYQFLSIAGTLDLFFDGVLLDTLVAPAVEVGDLLTQVLTIDFTNPNFNAGPDHEWLFRYDGPAGSQLLLDNIQAPGVANGDFQTNSSLPPWTLGAGNLGDVGITQLDASPAGVPAPASWVLMLLALAALGRNLRSRTGRRPA